MTQITWDFPHPSQRMPVFAQNVVATSQPLAAQAGLRMMLKGGNAADAALATAIALTVVEPTSNGLGSDAFALVWNGRKLHGFNGSGRSPRAWTPEKFAGLSRMPVTGWDCVTVPGAVDAWAQISRRFGRLDFADLFEPAIQYARHGFMVSPVISRAWAAAPQLYAHLPEFGRAFLINGKAPKPGEFFNCASQAESLEKIAESRGESFYRGELAQQIAACAAAEGGAMTLEDLADHQGSWVEPISCGYHGFRLHEIPPNGQGLAALIALGILRRHDLRNFPPDSPDSFHLQIEAMKIAFVIAHAHVGDPASMTVSVDALLSPEFLNQWAEKIRMDRAGDPGPYPRSDQGTVYLTAGDKDGMMVSFIQSNYAGFGSGVVVPNTGISLQNRGCGFRIEPGHPNCVDGWKRPYHTIIPGFVTRDEEAVMSFGVMGAHMQPQGHVQLMIRIFDYGQNPQAAADAPRWYACEDGTLALEKGFDACAAGELERRGHRIRKEPPPWGFGGSQIVYQLGNGYCAASDPRKDGQALGF
jgi:gamma-glutamyltranspeptidase/glutathione hydrolase